MDRLVSKFAPAERLEGDVLNRQVEHFRAMMGHFKILDALPECLVVLNQFRQIICANKRFCEFVNLEKSRIIGYRLGEILRCEHAYREPGGCGTSDFCSVCGAVNAMLHSIDHGETWENECRFTNRDLEANEFAVTSTPYHTEQGTFVLFSVRDISNQKRNEALEQVFFHDLLNAAGGLRGMIELLTTSKNPAKFSEIVLDLADDIIDEIKHQQMLAFAEKGELEITRSLLKSEEMLSAVENVFSQHEVAKNKQLKTLNISSDIEFLSDPVLLKRVLINMVKNAFEASDEGRVVLLSAREENGHIMFDVHNNSYMDKPTQLQVFQRSFSSKGKGRGLGSYSSRLLGEKYLGGKVSFVSEEKHGTTFTLALPLGL